MFYSCIQTAMLPTGMSDLIIYSPSRFLTDAGHSCAAKCLKIATTSVRVDANVDDEDTQSSPPGSRSRLSAMHSARPRPRPRPSYRATARWKPAGYACNAWRAYLSPDGQIRRTSVTYTGFFDEFPPHSLGPTQQEGPHTAKRSSHVAKGSLTSGNGCTQ